MRTRCLAGPDSITVRPSAIQRGQLGKARVGADPQGAQLAASAEGEGDVVEISGVTKRRARGGARAGPGRNSHGRGGRWATTAAEIGRGARAGRQGGWRGGGCSGRWGSPCPGARQQAARRRAGRGSVAKAQQPSQQRPWGGHRAPPIRPSGTGRAGVRQAARKGTGTRRAGGETGRNGFGAPCGRSPGGARGAGARRARRGPFGRGAGVSGPRSGTRARVPMAIG